jgi:hypothetical protein
MTPGIVLLQEMAGVSVPRFFAGFFLILLLYIGALLFTYWISKGE